MPLEHNAAELVLIVSGRAHRAAVPVVPQSFLYTPVTADPSPAIRSYGLNAAFMSFQPRDSGIHAVWPGAGEASVTEVPFLVHAPADGKAGRTVRVKPGAAEAGVT
jgi:hypothetical protein